MNQIIYFDNAASSFPKPKRVCKIISEWLKSNGANPGRSGHKLSMDAAKKIYETRCTISEHFNICDENSVVFVPNATYGLNCIIQGLFDKGDHIVTTDLEHNSVYRPLNYVAKKGVLFDIASVDLYNDDITVSNIVSLIRKNTKAIICTQCSNVCGKVLPIKKISKAIPDGVMLIVDGSQGAGILSTNVADLGIDYYCAPSHKGLLGIQGSGFISIMNKSPHPIIYGGTGSESFNYEQPDYLPDSLESGTLATPAVISMMEGIKFIEQVGLKNIYDHKKALLKYLYNKIIQIDKIIVYTDVFASDFVGTTCFNVKGRTSDEVSNMLSEYGICTRSGIHCAPLFHKKMNTVERGMVRLSFSCFNTYDEIDYFIKILNKI